MSRITQEGQGAPFELFQTSTDQSLATLTGSRFTASDGRRFVIVQNAGTALVSGVLTMGPKPISNHQNLATSTQAVGDTSVTVTLGGTLVTANQYQGGYVIFNAGTGQGQTLKIKSHPAQATTNGTVVLQLEDPIVVATASASTKSCLRLNPFGSLNGTDFRTSGVTITDHAALTGQLLGWTLYPIAATTTTVPQYGYVQTSGLIGALNDATTAQGLDLMPSANTDGAVQTYVVATAARVGTSTQAGVTTESRQIVAQL
jgi:hypothetical protein